MSAFVPRLLAAALAFADAALAQRTPPPAEGEGDIVVTAERQEAIRAFVGALTQTPQTGQIPRFEDSICPAAHGLNGTAREAVVARMRAVAVAAGLRTGGARCRPNVLLMVTADKRALIRALAQRYPHWFGDERRNGAFSLMNQPGPVAAWHAEMTVNADGRGLRMVGDIEVNQTTRQAGRIQAAARPAFIAAAVVVERSALVGLSTTQLADYAMMRALARTDPAQLPATGPATILRVIDAPADAEVPVTLTQWDLGFLRGLYASPANLRAPAQRGAIGDTIARDLQQAETTGD